MATLHIHYNNYNECRSFSSLQAANLIAINIMRNNPCVNSIDVIDNTTGEIYRTYIKE